MGCGPLGALLSLTNLVGPEGCVVGLDFNVGALATAEAILTQRGLTNVKFVHGDINTVALEDIPGAGSFDLAYCRLFLIHQRDPVAALRRMRDLVRARAAESSFRKWCSGMSPCARCQNRPFRRELLV